MNGWRITMEDKTYNGWTNYATWRVRLEICEFEMEDLREIIENECSDVVALMRYLKSYVEEVVFPDADDASLCASYALAFLDEVNYHEIANDLFDWYYEDQKYKDSIEYAKSQLSY